MNYKCRWFGRWKSPYSKLRICENLSTTRRAWPCFCQQKRVGGSIFFTILRYLKLKPAIQEICRWVCWQWIVVFMPLIYTIKFWRMFASCHNNSITSCCFSWRPDGKIIGICQRMQMMMRWRRWSWFYNRFMLPLTFCRQRMSLLCPRPYQLC